MLKKNRLYFDSFSYVLRKKLFFQYVFIFAYIDRKDLRRNNVFATVAVERINI